MTIGNHWLSSAAVVAVAVGLAGCGSSKVAGGPGDPSGPGDPGGPVLGYTPVYAADDGTAAQALADGAKLEAASGDGLTASVTGINWEEGTAAPGNATFAMQKNDSGGVDVTINDETVSFSEADASHEFGWEKNDNGFKGFNSYSGPTAEVLSPSNTNYSQLWNFWFDDDETGTNTNGFVVVGTETNPEALANKPVATYVGHVGSNAVAADDPNLRGQLQGNYGSVNMTADFGDDPNVTGTISNLQFRTREAGSDWSSWENVDGTLILERAAITGNGYKGQLGADAAMQDFFDEIDLASQSATYSGRFYGPAAEETAGTINTTGSDATLAAGFRAWEQP